MDDIEKNDQSVLNLTGKTLIAAPSLQGSFFERTVVYICAHSADEGSIGLVLARTIPHMNFHKIAKELELEIKDPLSMPIVHCGGPIDNERGFILHSAEVSYPDSHPIDQKHVLSTSVAVLNDIALGQGPENVYFALGYTGWDAGQLEQELRENAWITSDLLEPFTLSPKDSHKAVWKKALQQIGISPAQLSQFSGSA